MKSKWMIAIGVLSVAAVLGAAISVAALDDTTNATTDTSTYPLLTEQQLQDLRTLEKDLTDMGLDRELVAVLLDEQADEFVAENLASYGLTDEEVAQVMDMFDAIDDKLAEIRDVAYQMREDGATTDEIADVIGPMIDDLQGLQDQLVSTLEGYSVTMILPQTPPERPEGPIPPAATDDTSSLESIT